MLVAPYILFLLLAFSCKGYNLLYQGSNTSPSLIEVNSRGHLDKKEAMGNYDYHKLDNHQKE